MDSVLINEIIYKACKKINDSPDIIQKAALNRAEKQRTYDKAYAQKMADLKPQYPATILDKMVRGEMADLKYELDCAEIAEDYARDTFKALQTEVSGLQSILKFQSEV